MTNIVNMSMHDETNSEISYQNKDITAKYLTEGLRGKTLKVYGLPQLKIVDILPTNLPAIEANELRIDNILMFSDGSIGIIDYESSYTWEDKIKHINYIARILKRYERKMLIQEITNIRLIIIFTADIESVDSLAVDVGCMKVYIEPAYLLGIDTEKVLERLKKKVDKKELLSDEESMELIILPLTVKGTAAKQNLVVEVIEIAKTLLDEQQRLYVLSGVLTFSDKFINREFAKKVRESIMTLQVIQLIVDESEAKGKTEGKIQGKTEGEAKLIRVIRRKMSRGYDPSSISDILELPLAEVDFICALIHTNPADTDIQIAEKFLKSEAAAV